MNRIEDIVALLFVLGVFALPIWYFHRKAKQRSRDTFSELLAKDLAVRGWQLVTSIIPPPFSTGPFPQGITDFARPLPLAFTLSWQYRQVVLQDASGDEHVVWARLFFGSGEPQPQIDWQPELDTLKEKQNKSIHGTREELARP